MAKRFLHSFFKSNKHENNGNHNKNKENNDPLLLGGEYGSGGGILGGAGSNAQRRSLQNRKVNFQGFQQSNAAAGVRRRSCVTEVDEDGGSEVTLTATEAGRQFQHPQSRHHQQFPLNPYSVVTEPKRTQGPRSCPGGGPLYLDFDSAADNDSGSGGDNNGAGGNGGTATNELLDHSLEGARSEFYPAHPHQHHHRRSSRQQHWASSSRGGGGGVQQQLQMPLQQPFNEIGNGGRAPIGGGGRHRDSGTTATTNTTASASSSSASSRYRNLPFSGWGDSSAAAILIGKNERQMFAQLEEQKKELAELGMAYREERGRRKGLQRDLRREQEEKGRVLMENFRLQTLISLMLHQQPSQQQQLQNVAGTSSQAAATMANVDMNALFSSSLYPPPAYSNNNNTGNTPSSSSAVNGTNGHLHHQHGQHHHQAMSAAAANVANLPWTTPQLPGGFEHFLALPRAAGGGGPGECLAPPLLSSSSLLSAHQEQHHQQQLQQPTETLDEVKQFRGQQHNTDSFSGSSRPTTGELNDLDQDKHDLISDSSREHEDYSGIEIGRGASNNKKGSSSTKHNTTPLFGHSFSADELAMMRGDSEVLVADEEELMGGGSQQPLRDDGYSGYATSETSASASGAMLLLQHEFVGGNKPMMGLGRRSLSLGHIEGQRQTF